MNERLVHFNCMGRDFFAVFYNNGISLKMFWSAVFMKLYSKLVVANNEVCMGYPYSLTFGDPKKLVMKPAGNSHAQRGNKQYHKADMGNVRSVASPTAFIGIAHSVVF